MYGLGSGEVTSNVTGATGLASTVAGVAVLPNTGGNEILMALSIATMGAGALIITSFVLTRIISKLYR